MEKIGWHKVKIEDFVEPNYPALTSMSALVSNVEEMKEQIERLGNIVDLGFARLAEAQESVAEALDKIALVVVWHKEEVEPTDGMTVSEMKTLEWLRARKKGNDISSCLRRWPASETERFTVSCTSNASSHA